jgi:NADH:ubiquinone oxidoreductase subunit E
MGHCALAPAVMEDGRLLGAMSSRRLRSELMRLGVLDTE